jgi:hypothetical protein
LLKVVAEREIAEHFEEGEVTGGFAYFVEVICFTPGAETFLGGGRASVRHWHVAGVVRFELDHTCAGKQEGGVIAWDNGVASLDDVVEFPKEFQETGAYFITRHDFSPRIDCIDRAIA